MLEILRTETARVQLSLVQHQLGVTDSPQPIPQRAGNFLPLPNQFLHLRIKITNLSRKYSENLSCLLFVIILCTVTPLVFTVDVSMEPAEHTISEGVLTDIPIGRLESGESLEVETALCFLCFGRFDIRTEVRTLGMARGSRAGTGQLTAVVVDGK